VARVSLCHNERRPSGSGKGMREILMQQNVNMSILSVFESSGMEQTLYFSNQNDSCFSNRRHAAL
jgi:hypothetical protein